MEWYTIIFVIIIGIIAGYVNIFAGGGSVLSLSFFMFLGMPPNVANGTNRIAITLQNLVASLNFRKQEKLDIKEGMWYAVPSLIGAFIGVNIAVSIDQDFMEKIIGGILIFMLVLIIFKPNVWIKGQKKIVKEKPTILQIISFFFIGMYGGFIQVGIGFFLIAGLVLGAGFNLVKANVLKVFIVLLYSPVALGVFIYYNQVDYVWGILLAVGNMIGAYIASKIAIKKGPKYARHIVIIVIVLASLKFVGFYDLLFNF